MTIRKLFVFVLVVASICIDCNTKSLEGKIETRGNELYLINTSIDKAYQFTIRKATKINDSLIGYETEIIELFPGDEKYLDVKETMPQL